MSFRRSDALSNTGDKPCLSVSPSKFSDITFDRQAVYFGNPLKIDALIDSVQVEIVLRVKK